MCWANTQPTLSSHWHVDYSCHGIVQTSAIIRPVGSVSALAWFITLFYYFYCLYGVKKHSLTLFSNNNKCHCINLNLKYLYRAHIYEQFTWLYTYVVQQAEHSDLFLRILALYHHCHSHLLPQDGDGVVCFVQNVLNCVILPVLNVSMLSWRFMISCSLYIIFLKTFLFFHIQIFVLKSTVANTQAIAAK